VTVPRPLRAKVGGIHVRRRGQRDGLAGFLLAKTAAAYSRSKEKDWYDIAFVLLHNNEGGLARQPARTKVPYPARPSLARRARPSTSSWRTHLQLTN